MNKITIFTYRDAAGSQVKINLLTSFELFVPLVIIVRYVYAKDGGYIGNAKEARYLYNLGIKPELVDSSHSVCSIGFCEREQKWYGWSHRAICGFEIGDVVKEGSCTSTSGLTDEYLAEHPEEDFSLPVGFVAESLADCRRMAIAFADCVS